MFVYEQPDNLVTLFEQSRRRYPLSHLFGTISPDGKLSWLTYQQVGVQADRVRAGLARLGVNRGDFVGIIGANSPQWAIIALAAYGRGAQYVPMYEAELESMWHYVVADSGTRVLFVANEELAGRMRPLVKTLPALEHVISIEGSGPDSLEALMGPGASIPVPAITPDPADVATLVYTSGTTGEPKGVLLTHGNVTHNIIAGNKRYTGAGHASRTLSILPWAHSFGHTVELFNLMYLGGSIVLMRSVNQVLEDMLIARPTHLIAVPRIFNRIYDGLNTRLTEEGGIKKRLFDLGLDAMSRRRELAGSGRTSLATELVCRLCDRLVFSRIRARFGGRFEAALTASATMNPEVGAFFHDIGMPVYDCYGLSETSPGITMSAPGAFKLGSVGMPLGDMRVVIDQSVVEEGAADGEILCYGPNIMKGYHNKPEATAAVMTEDGGFRTGDRGRLDEDGYLFITGRTKEQYKLENGKYVFPAALEEDIRRLPAVANAMLYGDGRPFNVCLIVPDFTALKRWAREQNLPDDPERLAREPALEDYLKTEITGALKGRYGNYEIPRRFLILADDFSVEDGTLTQTLKLKRRVVLDRYGENIEDLYALKASA